jgi:hypothetical protein
MKSRMLNEPVNSRLYWAASCAAGSVPGAGAVALGSHGAALRKASASLARPARVCCAWGGSADAGDNLLDPQHQHPGAGRGPGTRRRNRDRLTDREDHRADDQQPLAAEQITEDADVSSIRQTGTRNASVIYVSCDEVGPRSVVNIPFSTAGMASATWTRHTATAADTSVPGVRT